MTTDVKRMLVHCVSGAMVASLLVAQMGGMAYNAFSPPEGRIWLGSLWSIIVFGGIALVWLLGSLAYVGTLGVRVYHETSPEMRAKIDRLPGRIAHLGYRELRKQSGPWGKIARALDES